MTHRPTNEFGFSNDAQWFNEVVAWREAAIKDGWSIEPTYQSESQDRASSLWKEGFHALILTRDNSSKHGKYSYEANVSVWGPDGLAVSAGEVYDWMRIKAGLRHCHACGANGVDTQRYSFAGRCCEACRPAMAAKHERGNWTA